MSWNIQINWLCHWYYEEISGTCNRKSKNKAERKTLRFDFILLTFPEEALWSFQLWSKDAHLKDATGLNAVMYEDWVCQLNIALYQFFFMLFKKVCAWVPVKKILHYFCLKIFTFKILLELQSLGSNSSYFFSKTRFSFATYIYIMNKNWQCVCFSHYMENTCAWQCVYFSDLQRKMQNNL